jgi:hypothetical protein
MRIEKQLTDDSIRNLRSLQGEFRLPAWRIRSSQLLSILQVVMGVIIILVWVHVLQRSTSPFRMTPLSLTRLICIGASGSVLIFSGARLWRKTGSWYRFASGQVEFRSRLNKVFWAKSLSGIVSGSISYNEKGRAFLTLCWSNSQHRIDIYPALADALREIEPRKAETEVELDSETPAETAASPWSCKSCGEEIPVNFEYCWKCQTQK